MSDYEGPAVGAKAAEFKVLLIDDSKLMRIAGTKMLGNEFNVVVAVDGNDGWQKIQQDTDIHVVFSDLNMPGMNGYELLKKIRSSDDEGIRNLPVIIVTGAEEDEEEDLSKQRSLDMGATDFITKPFNSTDLKARASAYADYQRTTSTLSRQTSVDPLTGLMNRRGFEEQLNKDIAFASRHREDLAIMQVAFDKFDELYARVGKAGSDSLVKEVGKFLVKTLRDEDTIARVGPSHFYISLPTAKPEGAQKLAERICRSVQGFNVRMKGELLKISVSTGVCSIDKGFKPKLDEALEQLDFLIEDANETGLAQVVSSHLGFEQELDKESFISIDRLLTQLQSGDVSEVAGMLNDAVVRLKPLVALLTEQQLNLLLGDAARP
jgi:diguanylate cyclase (GGDEF)-like protein